MHVPTNLVVVFLLQVDTLPAQSADLQVPLSLRDLLRLRGTRGLADEGVGRVKW